MFGEKKNSRPLIPVFITYFLDNFGLAIIFPIFTPLFLKTDQSILAEATSQFTRTVLLGVVVAAFPLAQFFGAPLIGQFSDRFGRKKAFFITILGTAIGYTLTAASILNASILFLFLSRFCTGLFAGNLTLCLAAIADMSPDDKARTKNFGQIGAVGGLSFISAIAFGGILSNPEISSHFNPSFPFWLTAFLSYVNLALMVWLFHETHIAKAAPSFHAFKGLQLIRSGLSSHELKPIYAVNFLFMLSWVASMQFFPSLLLHHLHFEIGAITLCLMGVGLFWSLSNLILNRIFATYFFPGKTFLICLFILALLLLSTTFSHAAFSFFFFFYPAVCCASLCWTNGLATVSLKAPAAIQGSILGINQSMTSMAAMLSPIIGGLLAGINIHSVYFFAGLMSLAGFTILLSTKGYQH